MSLNFFILSLVFSLFTWALVTLDDDARAKCETRFSAEYCYEVLK